VDISLKTEKARFVLRLQCRNMAIPEIAEPLTSSARFSTTPLPGINFACSLPFMGDKGEHFSAIEIAMLEYETLERLKRAIETSYQRLIESAREEWERRFAGKDPSDDSVSIRISSTTTLPVMPDHQLPWHTNPHTGWPNTTSPRPRC
jgi:hypothetical protein